jgi:hypothetical protein
MRLVKRWSTVACAIGLGASLAWAAEPTSPETKAQMIRLINGLEAKPYGAEADDARRVVLEWLTEAPDVSVNVCGALLVDLDALEKAKDDPGLLLQLMFSEARFILENPAEAGNALAVHKAGVEGVLKFYSAMQAEKPGLKIAPIEKIARAKADGKLDEFVTKAVDKCN